MGGRLLTWASMPLAHLLPCQSTSVETLYKQCRVVLEGKESGCIMVNHWALNTKDQMVSDTTYLTGLPSLLGMPLSAPPPPPASLCVVCLCRLGARVCGCGCVVVGPRLH
jgi:hypothetical protein